MVENMDDDNNSNINKNHGIELGSIESNTNNNIHYNPQQEQQEQEQQGQQQQQVRSYNNNNNNCSKDETKPKTILLPIKYCQECRIQEYIYQCPRCSFRSCSLQCCKQHKRRFNCSGKRDVTTFVRIRDMNDTILQSDYHFLENVISKTISSSKRLYNNIAGNCTTGTTESTSDTIKRPRRSNNNNSRNNDYNNDAQQQNDDDHDDTKSQLPPHPLLEQVNNIKLNNNNNNVENNTDNHPPNLVVLRNNRNNKSIPPKYRLLYEAAKQRNINLLFMPKGMERHDTNRTKYNKKDNTISWTIEWILHSNIPTQSDPVPSIDESSINTNQQPVQSSQPIIERKSNIIHSILETERVWDIFFSKVIVADNFENNKDTVTNQYSLLIKDNIGGTKLLYHEITKSNNDDEAITIKDILVDQIIIEYPTIEIVPIDLLPLFPRKIITLL